MQHHARGALALAKTFQRHQVRRQRSTSGRAQRSGVSFRPRTIFVSALLSSAGLALKNSNPVKGGVGSFNRMSGLENRRDLTERRPWARSGRRLEPRRQRLKPNQMFAQGSGQCCCQLRAKLNTIDCYNSKQRGTLAWPMRDFAKSLSANITFECIAFAA
jgi:hypothetical protein